MSLERSIKKINSLIPQVDKEIEKIIKNKISDINELERTLDYLMSPQLKKQFNKLVNYYKTIDLPAAEEYIEIYNELYE